MDVLLINFPNRGINFSEESSAMILSRKLNLKGIGGERIFNKLMRVFKYLASEVQYSLRFK